jgi:hypothetical protein
VARIRVASLPSADTSAPSDESRRRYRALYAATEDVDGNVKLLT